MGKKMSYRGNEGVAQVNTDKMMPVIIGLLFVILVGIAFWQFMYETKIYTDQLISEHVSKLVEVFKQIDQDCKIISFDYQKNHINFLNTKSFEGSEVGPLNLAYPQNWKGSYLKDNFNVQAKEYQVVKTKKGYFITPGQGVKLSNGKVIGKDIILDQDADIPAMMLDGGDLNYKGKALAAPLPVGMSSVGKVMLENIMHAEDDLVMEKQDTGLRLACAD